MVEELFVSYETAKKLKEKGFDSVWRYNYWLLSPLRNMIPTQTQLDHDIMFGDKYYECYHETHPNDILIPAPIYQQVVDWFREKHNIMIHVEKSINPENYYPVVNNDSHKFNP